jgi:hypothetical protein
MSLDTGRAAIETFLNDRWTETTIGMDGQPFTPVAPCIQLAITDGQRMQGSIGRVRNVINNIGIATVTIYTDAAQGSAEWRGYAQALLDLFHGVSLDRYGNPITNQAQRPLVRFSPPELGDNAHPYLGAQVTEAPFRTTAVVCPFVRYETI